ncbi:MAG: hypothetical protein WKF37_18975 [Bryobacteraceae bacterium]
MRTNLLALVAFIGFIAAAVAILPRQSQERIKMIDFPDSAKTPKEHVDLAKRYREQAEQHEEQAARHESEAAKLEALPRSPLAHKWPSMADQPWTKERQLASEARQAAKQYREASDRPLRSSVELLAEAQASKKIN